MRCWTCDKIVMVPDNKPATGVIATVAGATCSYCGCTYTVNTMLVGVRQKRDKPEGE